MDNNTAHGRNSTSFAFDGKDATRHRLRDVKEAYEEVQGHTLEEDYLMDKFSCWQNNMVRWSISAKNDLVPLLDALWRRMPQEGVAMSMKMKIYSSIEILLP